MKGLHQAYWLRIILLAMLSFTAIGTSANVAFPAWQRNYTGTIAGKSVEVSLDRTDGSLKGYYCYAPCKTRKVALLLSGALRENDATLEEKDANNPTGLWEITLTDDRLQGTWFTPDRQRHYPIELKQLKVKNDPGIDLILVADALPPTRDDRCGEPPTVSAIKLYKKGKLLQVLETESTGTCDMFLPQWEDVNFDGYPDLTIAQFLPAGPNIPMQTWLYDPQQQRFVDAPASYQEITSPDRDEKYQHIVSFWRGSCCSHGVNVYRWQGNEMVLVEEGSSYMQPVLVQGKMQACYVIPSYNDGRIVYPLQRRHGRLLPWKINKDDGCDLLITTEGLKTVIQPERAGDAPEIIDVKWQEDKNNPGSYCPLIPFFENNNVVSRLVTNKDVKDICMDEEAWKSFNTPQ